MQRANNLKTLKKNCPQYENNHSKYQVPQLRLRMQGPGLVKKDNKSKLANNTDDAMQILAGGPEIKMRSKLSPPKLDEEGLIKNCYQEWLIKALKLTTAPL